MNIKALYKYIANQLQSIIRIYKGNNLIEVINNRIDLNDQNLYKDHIEKNILAHFDICGPVLFSINEHLVYGKVETPNLSYILGPIYSLEPLSLRQKINVQDLPEELLHQTASCTLLNFTDPLLLLYNLFQNNEVSVWDCLYENCLDVTLENTLHRQTVINVFQKSEDGNYHNPYEQEKRELASIEQGDLKQLKKSWEEQYSGSYGYTSHDSLRNGKNLAIIVVALATRAAINGGILPEIALSLGDSYMLKIDNAMNPYNIGPLVKKAECALTELVKDQNTKQKTAVGTKENLIVNSCKNYIFTHLHSKITVKEIANHLYLHPNYLSALFKKEEGISLYQYITNEKISLVKDLLIYSHYSFSEISSFLGFTSQSHLGKVFKIHTGYTLKQYRNLLAKTNL